MRTRLGRRRLWIITCLYLTAGGLAAGIATADLGQGGGLPPPTGLAVTSTQTTLVLTWQPVPGATSYETYLDGKIVASTPATSWTYAGLQCATTHQLQVDARRAGLRSSRSSINGTTTACGQSGAPVNTALPTVSGTAQVGQVLTSTPGTWTGAQPIAIGYQWIRCDTGGANCAAISGANSSSYILTSAEVGSTVRSKVTATNSVGSAVAQSAQTATVQPGSSSTFGTTVPGASTDSASNGYKEVSSYTAPNPGQVTKLSGYISGLGANGGSQPVSAVIYADSGGSPGVLLGVSNTVTVPAQQAWGWVDFVFANPVSISGGRIWMGYFAGASDKLVQLRYDTSPNELHYDQNPGGWSAGPTNPFGSVTLSSKHYSLYATYNPTQGGTAPVNTVAPSITGQPQQGQVLTGSDGTWTGTQPITYARQWLRCDTGGGNCSPIGGATGSAYSITSSDVSSTIRFQVTGTNSAGSTSAQSAQTATITGGAPPPGPPPSGSANVWVDGGSGSCSRSASATTYVASSACNDLGSAYRAAHDGDTVGVVGGHYPAQEIDYSSGKSSSGPAVTFVPSGGVTIDSVSLGGNANGCIPAAPNWVTFDGGTNKSFAIHNFGACVTDHVTVERTQIGVDVATLGALAEFHSPQNFVFTNNVVGPACCGYDGTHGSSPIELRLAISSGDPNPTNVQVTNNRFQGSARTCAGWNSAFASQYGPCPATTCPDFDQCHNDAIHVYGCTNCTFDSNRFPYFDVQGIYLEEVNGSEQSGTIENNVFGHDIEGAWHTIWASFGQTTGTWNIRFNTLTEQNAIDANASDQHGRYGTGTINVVGNLGGRLGNDTGSCGGSSLNVVYRYNMWATSNAPWISHCDPTDGGPFDPLTISSWLSGDGHLLSGSSPPNGFVTGAGLCIGKDIDGDTRPATGCAAGSDEYEPG